jgi:hypothetical protein
MVTGSTRWVAPAILAAMAGCNELAGIRGGIFDPCLDDASDAVCATATSASSSSSNGSGGGGGSSSATTGGVGGFRSSCGDGVIDPGEECDDKGSTAQGCTHCTVDCAEPGAFKDPATAHCYWIPEVSGSFFESTVTCELGPGGRLATVTSTAELAVIASHLEGAAWIGASALGNGQLAWLDGEPWDYVAWASGEPSLGGKNLCVKLGGPPALFAMDDCAQARAALCERGP